MEFVNYDMTAQLGPRPESVAQHQQGRAAEQQCQINMRNMNKILMYNRSWTGLTKTASGAVGQHGALVENATVGRKRKRARKHVTLKQKRMMGRKMEVK